MYLPDGLSARQASPLAKEGTHVGIRVRSTIHGPRFQASHKVKSIGTYDTLKKALAARNTATL
eukprot:5817754-Prymnesium_polylepis.1